jgi:beta-lactamase class A
MINRFHTYIVIGMLPMYSHCTNHMTILQLQQQVTDQFAAQKGEFALAFLDIATGEQLLLNEQVLFHAASTMKTPVMIEVYKQVAAGKIAFTDSLIVRNEFKSIVDSSTYTLQADDDTEKELYKHVGEKRTLYSLLYDMIVKSSNLATNMIIELVDARKVTKSMREIGAQHIKVLRGVEDSKAYEQGLNNVTTAKDLLLIYEQMAKGMLVNNNASQAMINVLLDQQLNAIIPALLPNTVKVAHKTGNITGVQHDGGIVFLPNGRKYVLVLLSKNLQNEAAAIKAMAKVSKMIYQYLQQQSATH